MAGDVRGSDMRGDNDAYDKPDVVGKVAQTLEKFGGGQDDSSDIPPIPEVKEEKAEEEESTPVQDEQKEQEEQAEESESTPESSEQKAEGDKGEKAIPDNYYRALEHQGWTPEKISEMHKKDPDTLLEWGERAYESMNNLSQQFSKIGRAKIELNKKQKELQSGQSQQVEQPQQPSVDMEKLRQKYEDDPFGATVDLLKAFNQPLPTTVQTPTQTTAEPVSRDQVSEDLALVQHVIQFFGAEDMKAYGEFYGPIRDDAGNPYLTDAHLSPGQAANRHNVFVEADRIIAGASFQGEEMPVQQALAMAHLVVSAPITKQTLRQELVSQVKKKAKGVTLRPSSRKTSVPLKDGQAKPEGQLETDTAARISKFRKGEKLV